LVGTPDTEDIGLAHPHKCLEVEPGIEATTDETDSEPFASHLILQTFVILPCVARSTGTGIYHRGFRGHRGNVNK
jgi:hypothetical protein